MPSPKLFSKVWFELIDPQPDQTFLISSKVLCFPTFLVFAQMVWYSNLYWGAPGFFRNTQSWSFFGFIFQWGGASLHGFMALCGCILCAMILGGRVNKFTTGLLCLLLLIFFSANFTQVDGALRLLLMLWLVIALALIFGQPKPTAYLTGVWVWRILIAVVYFSSGIAKLSGPAWLQGQAFEYVLANREFSLAPSIIIWVPPFLLAFGGWCLLAFELTFGLAMLFQGTRKLFLVFGSVMHLFIAIWLGLYEFGLIMLFAYMPFWLMLRPQKSAEEPRNLTPPQQAIS